MTAAATAMNPAGGRVTRRISNRPRAARNPRVGLYVRRSGNARLAWRRFRRIGGEPSHDASGRVAWRGSAGAIDRTPTSVPSPSAVPDGTTALLPMKARRPRRVGATLMKPPSMRASPSDASSATVAPSSISRRSGVVALAVESSTNRPIRAPSARYQGAR